MEASEQRPTEEQPDDASGTAPHGDPVIEGAPEAGEAALPGTDDEDAA